MQFLADLKIERYYNMQGLLSNKTKISVFTIRSILFVTNRGLVSERGVRFYVF